MLGHFCDKARTCSDIARLKEIRVAKTAKTTKEETQAEAKGTVRMTRSEQEAQGGPITADVHPDEVENYKHAGWVVGK